MKHIITKQPFAEDLLDWESEEGGTTFDMNDEPPIVSFRDAPYESAEMKQLLSLTVPEEKPPAGSDDVNYKSSKVFPEWVLKNSNWKSTVRMNEEAHTVSDILKLDKSKRTPDQNSMVIKWLMSVWKIAFTMGFKRCGSMLRAFDYMSYQPGENIIEEGKRGLTFHIIISGETHVHKEGIGIVGQLGQGKSFGEIALTQGNDLRTATVTAVTFVECVMLHKSNFDYFVRDIQDQEKRENFKVLSDCKLFKTWPKGKIEKMSNNCLRRTFDAGDYIFHQGDPPNDLCIIVEGNVNIVKELVIVCKNRWPVGLHEWKERTKKIHKPILLKQLGVSDFFGEVAILKDQPRSTSAIALNRCVLLSLDKLEFLHLISYGNTNIDGNSIEEEDKRFNQIVNKYINDQDILDSVTYFRGGPDSQAVVGDKFVYKHDLAAPSKDSQLITEKVKVVVGPTTHNQDHRAARTLKKVARSGSRPSSRGSPRRSGSRSPSRGRSASNDLTLQQELLKESKKDAAADKLRNTASMGVANEKQKMDKLKAMGTGPPGSKNASVKFGANVGNNGTGGRTGSPNDRAFRKGSMVDQNGLVFRKAAANVQRRGSLTFGTGRRSSLQGVDNDPSFNSDPIVLLRQNSAINVGKVYEQVQRHLASVEDGQDSAAIRNSRGSSKLSPLRRNSSYKAPSGYRPSSPPPMDAMQLMSQWSSYVDPSASGGVNLDTTVSRKLSRLFSRQPTLNSVLGSPTRRNSSIASALAHAVAYANNASTPKSGAGGDPFSFSRSNTGGPGLGPGDISSSMKNVAPFTSSKLPFMGRIDTTFDESNEEHDEANFQDFMPTPAMARKNSQASLNRDTSLKLLNKAKISYREVMEG